MTIRLGRVLSVPLFNQNSVIKNKIPHPLFFVQKACINSFANHPLSFTCPLIDKSRISYPSLSHSPLIPKKAFSSSPKLENPLLIAECLEKIRDDPKKVPEILKSLSPELHEKLALSLLEKNPDALYCNLIFFTFKDKKILNEICIKPFSFSWGDVIPNQKIDHQREIVKIFKDLRFTDKKFLIRLVSLILKNFPLVLDASFETLGINDPEIIKDTLLYISKNTPMTFLYNKQRFTKYLKYQSLDTLKEICFDIVKKSPIEPTETKYIYFWNLNGNSPLNFFAKMLPFITENQEILEPVITAIADKDPISLIGALYPLSLSKQMLEKIAPKILSVAKNSKNLKTWVEEISLLGIETKSFIEESLLALSEKIPSTLIANLKAFDLTDATLQKVTLKAVETALNQNHADLSKIVEKLPTIGIQDQNFIVSILRTISQKRPLDLAIHLKAFTIPEQILQEIIVKVVDAALDPANEKKIVPFFYMEEIVLKLLSIPIQDKKFIESILRKISDTHPLALARSLKELHLSEDFLREFIHKILDKTKINIKTQPYILGLLQDLPPLLSDEGVKREFCKKMLTSLLEDKVFSDSLNFKNCRDILTILPSYHLNKSFMQESVLKICKMYPRSVFGLLSSFSLEEETLKKTILEQTNPLNRIANKNLFYNSSEVLAFLAEVQTLGIKDKSFMNEFLINISIFYNDLSSSSDIKLTDFPFTDKKTFVEIIKNLVYHISFPGKLEEFLDTMRMYDIKEPELLFFIANEILNYHAYSLESSFIKKLIRKDPETNLPCFIHIFGIENREKRIQIAKNVLKELCEADKPHIPPNFYEKFGISLKLLDLEKSNIIEEILTEGKVSSVVFYKLSKDLSILENLSPSFFVNRWVAESAESKELSSKESLAESIKRLGQFFQRAEIKEAFSQNDLFRNYLLQNLVQLTRNKNLSPLQKLDTLIELCQANLESPPRLKEITQNLILRDLLSSNYENSVYLQRLASIVGLGVENNDFWKKGAIAISLKYPADFVASLDQFLFLDSETVETIGVNILSKEIAVFKQYKRVQKLSKTSLLSIYNRYGAKLCTEGKCSLPPQVIPEIFSQILKYRNEALSDLYLDTFLQNINSPGYQKAFGFYTLTGKTKKDLIFIHKILPAIFLAKWDQEGLESSLPFRNILFAFFSDSKIRKTLRNPTQPLIQNLLFAASELDADPFLQNSERLKIFAQVCDLGQQTNLSTLEMADNLRYLRFICSLGKGSFLNHTFTKSASKELLIVFKKAAIEGSLVPNLAQIENIEQRFIETFFEKARIPGSLSTYESGFRQISPNIAKSFFYDLSRFVHICLEKKPEERYRTDINPDLKELSERFPDKFEKWKESLPPIEIESTSPPLIQNPIKNLNFISLIENELKQYQENSLVTQIRTNLKSISNSREEKEQLKLIQIIEKDLYLLDPIPIHALKSLEKEIFFLNTDTQKRKLIVKDIDDPLTLFEIPTLVCYSCQNIAGPPYFNQSLISYSTGGVVRMTTLVDPFSETFLARSVLRIVFEKRPYFWNSSPFLLLEPIYKSPKISVEEARNSIYEGALQKAESLNLPLYTKVPNVLGESKTIVTKGVSNGIYYSDYCKGEDGNHQILGKIPQKLKTDPLVRLNRDLFKSPIFWKKII